MVSRRYGTIIELSVAPTDPQLSEILQLFKELVSRHFNPIKEIRVETINGEPAVQSPFADGLKVFGFTSEYRELSLRRRF